MNIERAWVTVCVIALIACMAAFVISPVDAQRVQKAQWSIAEDTTVQWLADPMNVLHSFRGWAENNLSQAQLDSLCVLMKPADVSVDVQPSKYIEIDAALEKLGLPDDDPVVVEIKKRREETKPVEVVEVAPIPDPDNPVEAIKK